ncbi:nuclear transport factor 2 family protein [Arthrobacter sp. TMT4-20]
MDDIQRLIAESELRNIVARYPQLADDSAYQEWSELFTEDGVLEFEGKRTQGREAVTQWLASTHKGPALRHVNVNVFIVVDSASEAHGSADLVVLAAIEGAWTIVSTVRYSDRFIKTAEGWRFAERLLDVRSAADRAIPA